MFLLLSLYSLIVLCFKQKTAYEMRISDWSSDVCSSDIRHFHSSIPAPMIPSVRRSGRRNHAEDGGVIRACSNRRFFSTGHRNPPIPSVRLAIDGLDPFTRGPRSWTSSVSSSPFSCPRSPYRSEERRVGKECVSKC